MRLGQSLLAGDGRYPHLEKLLRREPPLGGARVQCEGLEEMGRLVREVEGSYLFVQGPPGSGKTWTGARLITYLISRGKRVAIASQSHKAIHKLLSEIEADALETGVALRGLKKASGGNPDSYYEGAGFVENAENAGDFDDADHDLFAGTAWLLTREELDGQLDYLFVDEAGQTSLADALALGTCAKTIVLLGDPVQLAQVTQGVHPGDAGRSVLAHLLGDRQTVAEDMGLFLERSFRMHPDVCEYISDAFYEGRLRSDDACARRASSFGTGIRWLPVEHLGNSTSSEEEAARDPRRDRAPAHGDVDRLEGRRAADSPRGRHGRRAVQRAGEAPPGAAPGGRRGRHRRQVPGSGGAGRLLLDGVLVGRRRAARDRLPHVAEPPERGRLAGAVPRLPRVRARAPRRRRADGRAHAARERALPLRRAARLRKLARMIAAMGTVKGPPEGLAEITRLSDESVGPWLETYEGYRGILVFVDPAGETSRVITLWDSPEHELAARTARGAMRDQLMATAGLEVVGFDVYEVPVAELAPE